MIKPIDSGIWTPEETQIKKVKMMASRRNSRFVGTEEIFLSIKESVSDHGNRRALKGAPCKIKGPISLANAALPSCT